MFDLLGGAGTAMWLGILTSISPCPLATNIAAVSYIGRNVNSSGGVIWAGTLYALGRMFAYVALGALLVYSLLSAPVVSHVLQKYMIRAIGPTLVLGAALVMEWIPLPSWGGAIAGRAQAGVARMGRAGGAALGFLFALTFCPVSAGLFFGALVPVALEMRSAVLLPAAYGFGTALPVIAVSGTLAAGAGQVGRLFDRARGIELWARRITAAVFLVIGVWFSARYTVPALWP